MSVATFYIKFYIKLDKNTPKIFTDILQINISTKEDLLYDFKLLRYVFVFVKCSANFILLLCLILFYISSYFGQLRLCCYCYRKSL